VQIARRALRFHFHVAEAAEADAERGDAFGVEGRVGDEGDVSLQLLLVFGDVFRDGRAADFLFAFDEHFDVQREGAGECFEGFERLDVGVHLALVVDGAAGVDVTVADFRFEGRGDPEFERVGRLDVVVPVAENGGLAGGVEPVGIDERMALGGYDFDVFEAGSLQRVGRELGRAGHVTGVFRQRGDAGNANELEEFFEQAGAVGVDPLVDGGEAG